MPPVLFSRNGYAMLMSIVFLCMLLAAILYYVVYRRKRASGNKSGVYVCHSCGEYDCICHRKDQTGPE